MAVRTNYEKNGKNYYRVTATIGKKADGKPIRKEFYGKSKKEAESKKEEYIKGLNLGLNSNFNEITLEELIKTWLFEVVKTYASHSTMDRYEGIYRNYIKETTLNSTKLNSIKPLTLQRHYNKLYYEDKKSLSVIKNLNKFLKTFFNYSIKEDYILSNPCIRVTLPVEKTVTDENDDIDPFTLEEIEKIKKAAKNYMRMIFLLDLGTGLRKGELLALTPADINFEKEEIYINKSLKKIKVFDSETKYHYETAIEVPKTKNSIRTVPIPKKLIPILRNHITKQKEKYLSNGLILKENSLIFTTNSCTPIDGVNMLRAWKRLLKRAGVRYRRFHNIRHTFASQLFFAHVELKTVQTLLGHSSINITSEIYVHVLPQSKIDSVEKINYLFS